MTPYEVIVYTTTKRDDYLRATCDSLVAENLWTPFKNVKISVDDSFHQLNGNLGIGAQWKFSTSVYMDPRERATSNFVQALRWGSGNLLLLEDDVIACKNAKLEIESYLLMKSIDSIVSFFNTEPILQKKKLTRCFSNFWGTQSLFYSWTC